MSEIAVVIPAYNAAATLGATLQALRAQTGVGPYEIIVVDNNSRDETAAVAAGAGARVVHETRRGPSAARNRGIASTDARIIAHLDADTVPSRKWLAALVAPFGNRSTILVAGNTQCYPPSTPAERYVARSGLYDTPRAIGREPFPFAPSLNMAVRRDAAIAVGGWTEELLAGEDVDFSHRILSAYETSIVYAEGAILYHRTRSDRGALVRQARTYGAGAAHLFRRYPDELRWDLQTTLTLCGQMWHRLSARLWTRVLGGDVEFADYHWFWTSNYWRGFFDVYLGRGEVERACG